MKKSILSFLFTVLSITFICSQSFTDISASITGMGRSAIAWGDYDNDGDLDFIMAGINAAGDKDARLYSNDEGNFDEASKTFVGVEDAAVAWGDYDNDGDLDLVLLGNGSNGDVCIIYRNDGGDVFTDIEAGLPGISNGDASWGDYDNDGDLDLFVTGNWMAKIFINDDGIFTDSGQEFGYWGSSRVCWGDYDNDGDLDVLLIGDSGAGARTKIFENRGGNFLDSEIELEGRMAGDAIWVDFDNDGDLDVNVSGYDDALEANFNLYLNQGDGVFEEHFTGVEEAALNSVSWGDFDNDGDLDILQSGNGTGCGVVINGIYENMFPYFAKVYDNFSTAIRSSLAWADYDNDGDLDFLISGLTYTDQPFAKIYRNDEGENAYVQNSQPGIPPALMTQVDGNAVTFSWEKASDFETPQDGLNYNIRLGSLSGECDVITPMSNDLTGKRKVQGIGNVNQSLSMTVYGLDEGTYYWTVQSIDQAFEGSEFAAEQSFNITITDIDDINENVPAISLYPNPAIDFLDIELSQKESVEVTLLNTQGAEVKSLSATGQCRVNISDLPAGIYFVLVKLNGVPAIHKFVKQ